MVTTAMDVPPTRQANTNADQNGILTLPEQSDSSSENDSVVTKTSTAEVDDGKAGDKTAATSKNDTKDSSSSSSSTAPRGRSHHAINAHRLTTSFDIETSPSPTKKRRVYSADKHVWDGFVRRGTRLKGFLENAMQLAATTTTVSDDDDTPLAPNNSTVMRQEQHTHAADLAREKSAECIILQQKLKEAEATAATLSAANASLREAASASNARMERTAEALRIAASNAANARADADAAEACAASMATQLQALRDVVDETKRASQVLYKEHEQVAAGARSVESKLLQRETELARQQKQQQLWMQEREEFQKRAASMQAQTKSLENEIQHLQSELQQRKHQADENAAIEQARKDRATMVEKELLQAKTLLMEATSTATETETTAQVLNETIASLETENKNLHETIQQLQTKSRQDSQRLNESLTKAEKEAQSLRVKAVSHEEDIQRARMDKSASDKEVAKLKTKVATLERRLKDSTSYTTAALAQEDSGEPLSTARTTSRGGVSFSIPPLTTNTPASNKTTTTTKGTKESRSSSTHRTVTPAPKSATCSICSQPASGFTKSCQCGKPTCNLRAHSTCIAKHTTTGPSVSHPGTPAMKPPIILCGKKV